MRTESAIALGDVRVSSQFFCSFCLEYYNSILLHFNSKNKQQNSFEANCRKKCWYEDKEMKTVFIYPAWERSWKIVFFPLLHDWVFLVGSLFKRWGLRRVFWYKFMTDYGHESLSFTLFSPQPYITSLAETERKFLMKIIIHKY